jgi:hypothetical protein
MCFILFMGVLTFCIIIPTFVNKNAFSDATDATKDQEKSSQSKQIAHQERNCKERNRDRID